jgi:hypothetical protein
LSSNINSIFETIIFQLDLIFKLENNSLSQSSKKVLTNNELRFRLLNQLHNISRKFPKKKIILYLDSIDQLISDQVIEQFDWFIQKLPLNTKLIYSILNQYKYENILINMRSNFLKDENNYLEINLLNVDSSIDIIDKWLLESNRKLTVKQQSIVKQMFMDNNAELSPLYLKLIFNVVKNWSSQFEPADEFVQLKNVDDCIKYLFKKFEIKYGKLLFSRIVIYMTIMTNGITENELEDVSYKIY